MNGNWNMETRTRTMTDECCHYGGTAEGWSVSKIELTNCHSLIHSLARSLLGPGEILWHLEWRTSVQAPEFKNGAGFLAALLRLIELGTDNPETAKKQHGCQRHGSTLSPASPFPFWLIFINTVSHGKVQRKIRAAKTGIRKMENVNCSRRTQVESAGSRNGNGNGSASALKSLTL